MAKKIPNEIEFLKASVKGDTVAFETIVKKYQSFICAITFSATGDVEKSEELAQEAFISAWKGLAQLKDLSKFRSWLGSIARNVIRNSFRSQKRDLISKSASMDQIEDVGIKGSGPVETAITKERQAVVRQALQQIPEKYREPLVLFYRQQQSVKEVAEQLELSKGAVRQRLSRGRKLLREQVAAMVETTISRTGPKKAFTTAVIASVTGMVIKGSAVGTAGIVAAASEAGTTAGLTTVMSGITAKIITAAVVAIGVGAVVTYKHMTKPEQGPDLSHAGIIAQRREEEQSLHKEQHNEANKSSAEVATDMGLNEHQETVLSKDIDSASPEQITGESISEHSDEPDTPKTGIWGIVINKANSKPIKGTQVFYGSSINPQGSFFTDANGHFEFLDMKPRRRQFFYIVAKDFTSRRITLDIIKNKVYENFKIELTPGSKVAGIVYDQNGKAVKGATVETFYFTNHPVITDANGIFEIDGLDPGWGQYSLHVTHPNYPASSTSFSPANAGETVWKDVVLKPGVTIYGQVTDVQGKPAANVSVGNTTSRAMWNCITTKTDHEGKYELKNVDAGDLVLWAFINKYAPYVERFSLDGSEAKKLINIQLSDPLPLYGKIVDKQGNPVPGVSISIREYKGVSNLANWQDRVSSDSEGKFVIPNAPPTGTVILDVFAEQVPNTHPELEVGQEEEYVIEVDRVGRVYGKVVDDKTGEPVKRFNVKLTFSKNGSKPGWGYLATWNREGHNFDSSEGFFDTGREKIPIGAEYSITVYTDGFDPLTIDPVIVQPISNDPNRTEFRLKPATAIAGKVVDSNSTPIAGARIRILSDNTDFEHWDDRDTTVTNPKGEFILSGVGSQERCIYITAETFAPYIGSSVNLPKNSEGTIQITLDLGAEVFGKVVDANGQGIADARVSVHIFSEQLREFLRSPRPNLRQTTTDVDGYYEFFDLPAGSVAISVNSSTANGNLNIAQKKISLKTGQGVELNFGDESGFTITGIVRAGEKPLEKAGIQIRLSDESVKWSYADNNGRFRIKGIPKGTYMVNTSYHSSFNPKTFQWELGEQISDRRQVAVEGDIELDINLGDGSVGGKIPVQFAGSEKLQITVRRWAPKKPDKDILLPADWEYAGRAKIDSEGKFTCPNLRSGRYYLLLLSSDGETLGITDDFELGESEHIDNLTFNTGKGTLQINAIDADTSQGISSTSFYIRNDLEATFYSKKWVPEGSRSGMITDDNGRAEYSTLPDGNYVVWAQTPGYLLSESEWVKVSDGEITPVTISLEPAAVVRFELDSEFQKRITSEYIYLRCRVFSVKTGDIVPMLTFYGEYVEHMVWLAPEAVRRQPNLDLPEGQYRIEYRLYQDRKGSLSYKVNPPLLEGTVNVEIAKGETKLITVSE